jgi:hypothetical protein
MKIFGIYVFRNESLIYRFMGFNPLKPKLVRMVLKIQSVSKIEHHTSSVQRNIY